MARRRPATEQDLLSIPGIGPAKAALTAPSSLPSSPNSTAIHEGPIVARKVPSNPGRGGPRLRPCAAVPLRALPACEPNRRCRRRSSRKAPAFLPVLASHGMVVAQEGTARENRRRHPPARRQCGRCGGRDRPRACRDIASRGQSWRRRLHAHPPRQGEENHRHRLPRSRPRRHAARRFSRCGRGGGGRRKSRDERPCRRRARNRRGPCARAAQLWVGQILARRTCRARRGACPLRHRRRG